MSQMFCKILITRNNLAALDVFAVVVKVTNKSSDCEIPSSPDTFQNLRARFVSMAWSTASESVVLTLHDLA